MSAAPSYEVIAPIYRSRHVLGPFLAAIGTEVEVTLVDNSFSQDDLADILADFPKVRRLDTGGNIGYSAAANLAAEASEAEYIVFANPDTRPSAAALNRMVEYLRSHPEVTACGAAGVGTTGGGAQPTFVRLLVHALGLHRLIPRAGIFWTIDDPGPAVVEWVSGSCLTIRRRVFLEVGGFDEAYFIYMSDIELGRRLHREGHAQALLGDVIVPHDDGGSSDRPADWVWRRRGAAWARFLRRTRRPLGAIALSAVVTGAYALRAAVYRLAGRRERAYEMRCYFDAFIGEWLHPEHVPFRPDANDH